MIRIPFLSAFLLLFIMISFSFAAERPQRLKTPPAPAPVAAPAILSIIPAQAEPGSRVMLFGSGFGNRASVFLGSVEIPARISDGKQAEFSVPGQLEPGLYAIYLMRGDGVASRPYSFTVQPLRPVLTGLYPDQISACAQGREREVIARGHNFNERSLLFFDGAGIRSQLISPDAIVFQVPQVGGGLHPVMVKNSPENSSLPLALNVDTKPEITQVTIGDDHVSYYDLIIDGRNFQQNSSIYVDGLRVGGRGGQEVSEREQLIYLDCTRLIYQRHPYSQVTKEFRLQVINPGGEGSGTVTVNAP